MSVDFRIKSAAFGSGNKLVSFDFSSSEDTLRFAWTALTLEIHPGASCAQNLAQVSWLRSAKEITLNGLPFSGRKTLEWGELNKVFPTGFLLQ